MKEPVTEALFMGSATLDHPFRGQNLPEFAFAGRSNVGKSSLINLITGRAKLAHVSATPGKTQTINYYRVENKWYLVDLPGYGYAKRSREQKKMFSELIMQYLLSAANLYCVFVLLDSRLPLQQISWLPEHPGKTFRASRLRSHQFPWHSAPEPLKKSVARLLRQK